MLHKKTIPAGWSEKREKYDMCDTANDCFFERDLNPTFLYTWKGVRTQSELNYHSHDYIELVFVLSGKCRYRIDGNVYDVTEKDLVILNPGVKHQALVVESSQTPSTEFYVAFSDICLRDCPENTLPVPGANSCILHTTGELSQKLFKISTSMEAENAVRRPGHSYMMKSYLVQMILLLIREQYEPIEVGPGYTFKTANKKYVVEQILNYFEDHYSEKISLDQIAENMYLSPFYISKVFKSETGDTPINRLIDIRLEKAKELLDKGESIREVASKVGYEDAYHFSKLFKKRYGMSPSRVKK